MSTSVHNKTKFDYEAKLFAESQARLDVTSLSALKLKYCLDSLSGAGGKLLEIGCGGGGFVGGVKKYLPKLRYIGIDLSQKAIEYAQKNYPKIKFLQASAEKLPFPDLSFDAIILVDTLEHIPNTQKVISEVRRVLKNKGVFYLCCPVEGNIYTIYRIFSLLDICPKRKYAGHIHQFTTYDLLDIIKSSGFIVENKWFINHLIFQFFDFGYFSVLAARGRGTSHTLEGYIKTKEKPRIRFLKIIKDLFARITYLESRLFWWLPASTICLKIKKGQNA